MGEGYQIPPLTNRVKQVSNMLVLVQNCFIVEKKGKKSLQLIFIVFQMTTVGSKLGSIFSKSAPCISSLSIPTLLSNGVEATQAASEVWDNFILH